MLPTYKPLSNSIKPTSKMGRVWPEGAMSQQNTSSTLFYINYSTKNVPTVKEICVLSNLKPWMTKEVRSQWKIDAVYRTGDVAVYSLVRANLKWGIKAIKLRIEDSFYNDNPRHMLQGIWATTDYRRNNNPPINRNHSICPLWQRITVASSCLSCEISLL